MERQTVLSLLRCHQADLAWMGALSVSIIGSTARGDAIERFLGSGLIDR